MAVKDVEWNVNELGVEDFDPSDLLSPSIPDETESDLEDGASAIWPCGEFLQDGLPPAPGRYRRVPHDW
jgi:hypothetical protein